MKKFSSLNPKNKTVLLRTDLNSNVVNGKVLPSERIKQASETIKILKNKKAKIVVIAHQGRPGKKDCISLKQHAKFLNKFTKIKFVNDILGKKAQKEIKNLKSGQAILLENIRFEKDEFNPKKKNNKLKKLTELTGIYINDAFSNSHRDQTSMTLFPKYLPSYPGPLLEKELNALKKIPLTKTLFILGGAKPKDNIKLLNKKNILTCGLFGQICLINKGKNLGAQNKFLKKEKILIKIPKLKNVKTPIDFAVKKNNKRIEIPIEQFPSEYEIFDIGEKTIKEYSNLISKAHSIYMKGPAGFSSDKKFSKGTNSLLKAIAKSKAFSLIGGGHLADAIKNSKIPIKKFNHVSLSGGALLRYIAGEKLVGLEALEKSK